jgi:hypothetical protein
MLDFAAAARVCYRTKMLYQVLDRHNPLLLFIPGAGHPLPAQISRQKFHALPLGLPRAALEGPASIPAYPVAAPAVVPLAAVPFNDPDPFQELRFPSILAAKLAIADYLGRPLAKLAAEDLDYIEALLKETLERRTIITCVRGYFRDQAQRQQQGEDGGHAR